METTQGVGRPTEGPWEAKWGHVGARRRLFVFAPDQDGMLPWCNGDAHLIAAAPDLLEACKAFVAYDSGRDSTDVDMMLAYADAKRLIEAAIAKAEGGAA